MVAVRSMTSFPAPGPKREEETVNHTREHLTITVDFQLAAASPCRGPISWRPANHGS